MSLPCSTRRLMQKNSVKKTGRKQAKSLRDLYAFQRQAIEFLHDNDICALWIPVGLGKTITILTFLAQTRQLRRKTLVIAPIRVIESVWAQEAGEWEQTHDLTFSLVRGTPKQRVAALARDADIYLTNYEGLPWLARQRKLPDFDTVVYDEVSKLSNPASQRVKSLMALLPRFSRRIGLTATPATNGLTKLYGQYLCLDGGKRLGKYITHFRNKYCKQDWLGYNWEVRKEMRQPLYDAIKDITYTVDASSELPDLPPFVFQNMNIHLPAHTQEQYKQLEKEFFLELDHSEVEAFNAGALSQKLQQFCNGAMYTEDGRTESIHEHKLDALEELVDSLDGKPLLVFYKYQFDLDNIKARLPSAVSLYDSSTEYAIDQWNAGKTAILLAHPASAGHGLNLQHGGNNLCWYGLPFDLELYEQANGRLRRSGQKYPVGIHQIVAKNTIEDAIMGALFSKAATQRELIEAIKRYRTKTN